MKEGATISLHQTGNWQGAKWRTYSSPWCFSDAPQKAALHRLTTRKMMVGQVWDTYWGSSNHHLLAIPSLFWSLTGVIRDNCVHSIYITPSTLSFQACRSSPCFSTFTCILHESIYANLQSPTATSWNTFWETGKPFPVFYMQRGCSNFPSNSLVICLYREAWNMITIIQGSRVEGKRSRLVWNVKESFSQEQ